MTPDTGRLRELAKAATVSATYADAMRHGLHSVCARIEKTHGLYGYPPELVSVGLAAVDAGKCPQAAVEAYVFGSP